MAHEIHERYEDVCLLRNESHEDSSLDETASKVKLSARASFGFYFFWCNFPWKEKEKKRQSLACLDSRNIDIAVCLSVFQLKVRKVSKEC